MNLIPSEGTNESEWVRTKLVDNSIYWERINLNKRYVPNVVGMTLKDAIFLLESRGLKVSFKGKGRVKYQNIPPGKLTKNFNSININLGWKN